MTIELTSREREVLRQWGKDPDLISSVCHKRPEWIDELMSVAGMAAPHGVETK